MTKDELISKVIGLVNDACYGWRVLDGLASREHIEAEQKRIQQDGDAIIEYIQTHC